MYVKVFVSQFFCLQQHVKWYLCVCLSMHYQLQHAYWAYSRRLDLRATPNNCLYQALGQLNRLVLFQFIIFISFCKGLILPFCSSCALLPKSSKCGVKLLSVSYGNIYALFLQNNLNSLYQFRFKPADICIKKLQTITQDICLRHLLISLNSSTHKVYHFLCLNLVLTSAILAFILL